MIEKNVYKPGLISSSPLHITLFDVDNKKTFGRFNELFQFGITECLQQRILYIRRSQLVLYQKRIRHSIELLKKKLNQSEGFEDYMHKGDMILANITKIPKGKNEIIVSDPSNNQPLKIEIDPSKNAQANAQMYFRLFKKHKRAIPRLKQKIEQLKAQLTRESLEKTVTLESIIPKTPEKPQPFRIFKLVSGSTVYVGKSSRSNDELTFAFAQPHDYFFHVRGYEGAHVILRHKTPKGQRPSGRDIQISAEIAVYFSKAKSQKKVPVSYTQRKYLKKGKKSKPGTAIMLREEVIFVDPCLPES